MTVGRQGVHRNLGIPGTGLSFRSRIDGQGRVAHERTTEIAERRREKQNAQIEAERRRTEALSEVSLKLKENGSLEISDAFGEELRGKNLQLLWTQHESTVRSWLEDQRDKINGDVSLLEKIHEDSPHPDSLPIYEPVEFEISPPVPPQKPDIPDRPEPTRLPKLGTWQGMFKSKRLAHAARGRELDDLFTQAQRDWSEQLAAIDAQYDNELRRYAGEQKLWERKKSDHEIEEREIAANFTNLIIRDVQVMEREFDRAISQLDWPRETRVSYDIGDSGETVWLDVDLPEIED